MSDSLPASSDPRWGQEEREGKAKAILGTLMARAGPAIRRGTWLDIGCGSGGVSATLALSVDQVIGVDPEPWQRWRDYASERPNLECHRGSYRDLCTLVSPDSVDVVVCNQVYEHVDDPQGLLEQIHRVLKPGGWCYFAGPNLLWPIEPHVHWPIVHWLPRKLALRLMAILGSRRTSDLDAWSSHYWALTRLFRRSGFMHESAVVDRIATELAIGEPGRVFRLAAKVPRRAVNALTPLLPSFVFLLRKPQA